MLLNDIGKSPDATFRRINQHLETNYGFKISESVSDQDLVTIMEQIEEEITDLKINGDDAKASPEISKRLLVLEGIRNLREYAIMQFQSPELEKVVGDMVDFVVNDFKICGTHHGAFEESVRDAMKQYRSSKYRFPDDIIEQRVRQGAMTRLQTKASQSEEVGNPLMAPPMFEDTDEDVMQDDDQMKETDLEEAGGGRGDEVDWAGQGSHVRSSNRELPRQLSTRGASRAAGGDYDFAMQNDPNQTDADGNPVKMVRDKHGRMVPDPWAAQQAARKKGIVMKEHANLVKNLRRLLETEVSQAEVMMAAKGFAQELQEMVEKIGRLQNEDLPPVTDQMRETYGMESASAFQTQIYGALQSVMDALYTAKGQVDDAVGNMASTGQFDASVDMEKDPAMGGMDGMDDTMAMDADAGIDADLDNIAGDMDAEDEFGSAEEEEPLGRSMKTESLQRKVMEMQKLVAKARKLKEAKKRA